MKHKLLLSLLLTTAVAQAAPLSIPSDGSDGVLDITTNTVINLDLASAGPWNANNSGNAGNGIYDSNQWAIVFKYQSVRIASNATVTFRNHASRAPVVWLVQSNATIDGWLNLNGQAGTNSGNPLALIPVEGAPGGGRGGAQGPDGNGAGLGWGGGHPPCYITCYGNPEIIPLIGGSGSSAFTYQGNGRAGNGGGGAILIACAGSVTVNGKITADGGPYLGGSFNGSGGAVKLIAAQVDGTGSISVLSDTYGLPGRIRIETPSLASSLRTFPETIMVQPANPPKIWPPDNAPKVRILSVAGTNAPPEPTAQLRTSADIAIQANGRVVVLVETRNFPLEGIVQVRIAEKYGPIQWLNTTNYLPGSTSELATWRLLTDTPMPLGFTTLQARATVP
jgi:hypothetical protein